MVRHGQVVDAEHVGYRRNPGVFVPVGTPHDARPTLADFLTETRTTTVAPARKPDGRKRPGGLHA